MSFRYDGEELGYEEGYESSILKPVEKEILAQGNAEVPPVSYRCNPNNKPVGGICSTKDVIPQIGFYGKVDGNNEPPCVPVGDPGQKINLTPTIVNNPPQQDSKKFTWQFVAEGKDGWLYYRNGDSFGRAAKDYPGAVPGQSLVIDQGNQQQVEASKSGKCQFVGTADKLPDDIKAVVNTPSATPKTDDQKTTPPAQQQGSAVKYDNEGWRINDQGKRIPDDVKVVNGVSYEKWTNKNGTVEYGKRVNGQYSIIDLKEIGGNWPTSSVAPSPPPAPGARTFNHVAPVTPTAQPLSLHQPKLENQLKSRGFGKEEVDAYMTKFDNLKTPTARDAEIQKDLKRLEDDKEKKITGDDLRKEIATRARDKGVDRFKASDVSPRDAYDNLVARGIVKPKIEKGVDVNRPAADAKWSKDPKDTSPANPKNWDVVPAKGTDAKRITEDPLVSKADFKTNAVEVRKDTERRQYLKGAYEKYKAWAMTDPGNPPNYDKGLGIKDEAEVRKRFDKLTIQLKLTNSDGTPAAFDPNATGENDPAQAFFPVKDGETRFNDDGTLKTGVKFRHENPSVDDSTVNPVTRVTREQTTKDLQRDTLFASLTGQVPEGSKMKVVKEEGKTYLVGPDGNKIEIRVIDPPFTPKAATAYMQSKGLVDADGRPLAEASPDQFLSVTRDIQMADVGRETIKMDIAKWERQEIVKILSGPPHKMKDREIVRYMHSKGWLGNNPNLESMEDFRKKAATSKAGSDELRQVSEEVKKADVVGNDPIEQIEKDRGAEIMDMLDKKGKNDENRAGRGTSRDEGAANRDVQWRTAVLREDRQDGRDRATREFNRSEEAKKRDFQAEQAKIEREHKTVEAAKDRSNQMMMSLIQFLGSMITAAMQAMTTVVSASIQSTHGLAGNTVAGIRGGRQ